MVRQGSRIGDTDEDGQLLCSGDSSAVIVYAESDPAALVFNSTILYEIKESPALYALINEINADIVIGQIYFSEDSSEIRYYYRYPADNPSPDSIAYILAYMVATADHYDDRLKIRLGGERFFEQEEDEVDV